MRKPVALMLMLLSAAALLADSISFSGGTSSVVLRDGRESVVLSEGASVAVDTMSIKADTITLSGSDWRYVMTAQRKESSSPHGMRLMIRRMK